MRTGILIAFGLVIGGCAASLPIRGSLEPYLPEAEPDGIQFFHGSWIAPDAYYAFQITDQYIAAVSPTDSGASVVQISSVDCPELIDAYGILLSSIFQISKIASGEIHVPVPNEIVMDGPDYRIEYWSRSSSTTISLTGGGNAQLVTPWIDAALKVRHVAENCADS